MSKNEVRTPAGRPQIRNLRERRHDTYKLRGKLPEPTVCPQCSASYHKGHWTWEKPLEGEAHSQLCQACKRINDRYPAGELTISRR